MEAVKRDFNHPSIVGWCPFNETNGAQRNEILRTVYDMTKKFDPTRPVIDTSGWIHVVTDVFDVHDYSQDPAVLKKRYDPLVTGEGEIYASRSDISTYTGQPYFVSEFGGTWWKPGEEGGWGYGDRPKGEKEFVKRFKGLVWTLLDNPGICAFCYTQLYDIELECNGLYTYERIAKFDPKKIKKIMSRKAAIES
jgi:hypothetical protein